MKMKTVDSPIDIKLGNNLKKIENILRDDNQL